MKDARVLLVEDSEDDALLIRRAFRIGAPDLDLEILRDGTSALDRLEGAVAEELPRLVLLDLRMPGISGFEVLRRIRENPRTRFMPVVILSNSALEADRELAFDQGANSYLQKPLDEASLTQIVRYVDRYWVPLHRQPREDR